MKVEAFGATHIGKVKDNNEDNFFADPDHGIFILADGMGGHAAGEVASQMAVEIISKGLTPWAAHLQELAATDTPDARKEIFAKLEEVVRFADKSIFQRATDEIDKKGMATTLDVLFLAPTGAFIAHVGDSRVYMIRGGQSYQLTTDHTLANHLRTQGRHTDQEIEELPQKNALVRAMGMPEGAQADMIHMDVIQGDQFMLCSDGLSGYVKSGEQLVELIKWSVAERSAELLTRFANDAGGRDNVTALVILVGENARPGRKTLETTLKLKVLKNVSLLKGLTDQEMLKLLRLTEEVAVDAVQTVIEEGQRGDEMFVLLEGEVEVESSQVSLSRLGPGAQFGELALVDDRPRSATVRTISPVRLLVLRRADFYELTRAGDLAPKLLWNLIHDIADRLRTTSWQLTEQVRASNES